MSDLVNPLDVLEFASQGKTPAARMGRNWYFSAALKAYDTLRFNHDLIQCLAGYLVDFAMERYRSGKNTSQELLTQEAVKQGRHFVGLGFEQDSAGWIVKPTDYAIITVELYGDPFWSKLRQKTDTCSANEDDLLAWCKESIDNNPQVVKQISNGKPNAINALKGIVIKRAQGRYSPKKIDEVLRQTLGVALS